MIGIPGAPLQRGPWLRSATPPAARFANGRASFLHSPPVCSRGHGVRTRVTTPTSIAGNLADADADVGQALSVEEAFQRYHPGLLRFLRQRLRNDEDAADAAQETYVRLVQSYRRTLGGETAYTLIFRIAANIANDHLRRRKTHHATDHCSLEQVAPVSEAPSQERQVSARQQLDLLYAAIERLPPKCQQVFLLNRVDRMSYPQIARRCGISVKMVEKHIARALAALRAEVGDLP